MRTSRLVGCLTTPPTAASGLISLNQILTLKSRFVRSDNAVLTRPRVENVVVCVGGWASGAATGSVELAFSCFSAAC